jgi:hypothetical protein
MAISELGGESAPHFNVNKILVEKFRDCGASSAKTGHIGGQGPPM